MKIAIKISATRHFGYELNPIFGKRPNRLTLYGIKLPVDALCIYYAHKFKREDDALAAAGLKEHAFRWHSLMAISIWAHGTAAAVNFTQDRKYLGNYV